ncbi:MAG: hypothetical protein K2N22_00500 [Clostridia bacterium]|nr:hypothetical protein [Clostridia bacterium]
MNGKFPVVVGVTGHRNIVEEDKPAIKAQVIEALKEILALCENRPVVMLNAFAQGADMLCAEAAFELGIEVRAVLPCEKERYINSFDDQKDKSKLFAYLEKTSEQFVSPDIEKCKERYKKAVNMDDESYEYRQLGIYMAEQSHILIALWDGKPPKVEYGCGTVEVIDFALERGKTAVWIKSRRYGDGSPADIKRKWLVSGVSADCGEEYGGKYRVFDSAPEFLKKGLRMI